MPAPRLVRQKASIAKVGTIAVGRSASSASRHTQPRHLRTIPGAVDPEAAARPLAALATLLDAHLEQLGEQALHGATHFRAPVHGFREQTPVAADDEAVIHRLDLGERPEIGEETASGLEIGRAAGREGAWSSGG